MSADKHRRILKAVLAATKVDGGRKTLTCAEAHRIADEHGAERRLVGEICKEQDIRVVACQLGLFP